MEMSEGTSLSIPNAGSMFGRRHRWRANIELALGHPLTCLLRGGGGVVSGNIPVLEIFLTSPLVSILSLFLACSPENNLISSVM